MTEDRGPFADMDEATARAVTAYGAPLSRQMVTVSIRSVHSGEFADMPKTINGWRTWLDDAQRDAPAGQGDLQCVLRYEECGYDAGTIASLDVWYQRPETDAEMTDRIGKAVAYVNARAAAERAQYEALKRKFEK